MPYVAPTTVSTGDVYQASAHNVIVNDLIDHEARLLDVGMDHVRTETFTTSSGITLDSIFPSNVDFYRIFLAHISSVDGAGLIMRLRASSADQATAYYQGTHTVNYLGSASATWNNANNATSVTWANIDSTNYGISVVDLRIGDRSQWSGLTYDAYATAYAAFAGERAVSARADGIKLSPSSGTMTGVCRIYSYRMS